jgi:hypothetical protein
MQQRATIHQMPSARAESAASAGAPREKCADASKASRSYFGKFDPFGDFALIFGASKLGLKIIEIPLRYANRTYGVTKISRFRHGLMLLRVVFFAFLRIKAL